MGRYAQQAKRGGHQAADGGLPAGPGPGDWTLTSAGGYVTATYTYTEAPLTYWWRARWRRPSLSMLWTYLGPPSADASPGETLASLWPAVAGQEQQCEIVYVDEDGEIVAQWSAYKFVVP